LFQTQGCDQSGKVSKTVNSCVALLRMLRLGWQRTPKPVLTLAEYLASLQARDEANFNPECAEAPRCDLCAQWKCSTNAAKKVPRAVGMPWALSAVTVRGFRAS
jgi:hypothetical protein